MSLFLCVIFFLFFSFHFMLIYSMHLFSCNKKKTVSLWRKWMWMLLVEGVGFGESSLVRDWSNSDCLSVWWWRLRSCTEHWAHCCSLKGLDEAHSPYFAYHPLPPLVFSLSLSLSLWPSVITERQPWSPHHAHTLRGSGQHIWLCSFWPNEKKLPSQILISC